MVFSFMFASVRKPQSPRVLVVDDNVAAAQTMAMLLSMNGYDVSVAEDGRTALGKNAELRPDIILLDVGLPDMSGHEVAKRIRDELNVKTPVIVAVTGWERQDMHPAESGGECDEFDFFLTKPVNYDDLDKLLRQEGDVR
jgi:CheY-like chemotaxis protein